MSLRSKIVDWGWGAVLALPGIGLFLAFEFTSGWVSTTSLVLLVSYVVVGGGYGLLLEARAWEETEDEFE